MSFYRGLIVALDLDTLDPLLQRPERLNCTSNLARDILAEYSLFSGKPLGDLKGC